MRTSIDACDVAAREDGATSWSSYDSASVVLTGARSRLSGRATPWSSYDSGSVASPTPPARRPPTDPHRRRPPTMTADDADDADRRR
jgi:hypothetical protein